jgi:3-oxoacyl-[acyl-carrier protein] reductase
MKVALVTGASRGLGAQIAIALGEAGWAVAANYLHDDAGAEATVAQVRAAGGKAQAFRFDVTDHGAILAGFPKIASRLGPVDLIVNNACGPQGAVPLMRQDWALYQRHLDFFLKAPLELLQAALPDWRARKSGRVINIGSDSLQSGEALDAHYVAAKGAMLGFTRSVASELGLEKITVNMVSPGWTPVERHEGTDPQDYARHVAQVPLGRLGRRADVAGTVVFVASPAAVYITGQNFLVNGGRSYG